MRSGTIALRVGHIEMRAMTSSQTTPQARARRVTYRTRHREKSEIWVESTLRVTRKENGAVNGVVAISRDMTLEPGDVIACGTSIGAGRMKPGSTIEISIDGIGSLKNLFEG